MIKVRIEMDERWCWWPTVKFANKEETEQLIAEQFADNLDMQKFVREKESSSMEITEELFNEYQEASARFQKVMGQLEQLYRKQEGYSLYETPELPEHRMLDENERTVGS